MLREALHPSFKISTDLINSTLLISLMRNEKEQRIFMWLLCNAKGSLYLKLNTNRKTTYKEQIVSLWVVLIFAKENLYDKYPTIKERFLYSGKQYLWTPTQTARFYSVLLPATTRWYCKPYLLSVTATDLERMSARQKDGRRGSQQFNKRRVNSKDNTNTIWRQ